MDKKAIISGVVGAVITLAIMGVVFAVVKEGHERKGDHKYDSEEESMYKKGGERKGQGKNHEEGEEGCSEDKDGHTVDFSKYKINELTESEKKAIIHMREEEKMARDIYRTLSKTTDSKVFVNIPISENKHMDVFHQLIDRYDLADPVIDEANIGTFTDPEFTKLFNTLVEKGKLSDKDAYEAGLMVEDLNMYNLLKYSSETEKADLKLAYDTLFKQSRHHMAAFNRQLEKVGGKYTPTYITMEQFEEAINSQKGH
ncbi:MAG TPA: DUF2202 domain-containing protein [Bacteroidia bacterium]|nr:DUF2202 domain-containing protein [Bacteroidia bacterium]